jgi:malonyl-CoA O-methyltransferase
MDMEVLTLTYASLEGLFADLKATGSTNAMRARARGLTGRNSMAALSEAYEGLRRAGRLPATFEVIYGHAWKPAARRTVAGEAIVRFAPRRK